MSNIRVKNKMRLFLWRVRVLMQVRKRGMTEFFRLAESTVYGSTGGRTSVSDNGIYPEICDKAAQDNGLFLTFRSDPAYRIIVGGVSAELGEEYRQAIELLVDDKKEFFKWIVDVARQNDKYGNPYISKYCFDGKRFELAPDTMFYCKVVADLEYMFGDGYNSVTEIGVGYGGLIRLIESRHKIDTINMVDLPQVLNLVKEYLGNYSTEANRVYYDGTKLDDDGKSIESDLLISNYAFSELDKNVQDIYLKYIIANAKSGYMIVNTVAADSKELKGYSWKDICEIIPGSRLITGYPRTRHGIIVWGYKQIPNWYMTK